MSDLTRIYRTSGGETLAVTGDRVVLGMSGKDYFLAGISENRGGSTMHVHVPGLDILVAVLRYAEGSDSYTLRGVDDIYPGLSSRAFERTEETSLDGDYQLLPSIVPETAFLAGHPGVPYSYVMAVLDMGLNWHVFLIDGDPYSSEGASGTKQEISGLGSAGIAAVTFQLNGYSYELANSPFGGGISYRRDNLVFDYHDVEQFRIVIVDNGDGVVNVQLLPLAHAQRP